MGGFGSVLVLLLAGWSFLNPGTVSWAYIAAFVAFELWLLRRIAAVGRAPVAPGEPPYQFSDEEAQLVARYRFYFTWPGVAKDASSVLAAIGLTALVLAPWLLFKQALFQAALVAINVLAVGRLTKELAPMMALRIPAARGDRTALRRLEAHDSAWAKIRAA